MDTYCFVHKKIILPNCYPFVCKGNTSPLNSNNNTMSMDSKANKQANLLLRQYEIFKDGVNWLRTAVKKTFFKYLMTYMISKMKVSSEIDQRRKLIVRFAYLFNVFLLDYDYWLTGTVKGLKFHLQETSETDNTNLNSQHQLLRCLTKIAGKSSKIEKATSVQIENIDLELNFFQWKKFS